MWYFHTIYVCGQAQATLEFKFHIGKELGNN